MKLNRKITITIVSVVIIIILIIVIININNKKTLVCAFEKELIPEFTNKETVNITLSKNKITNIKLDKSITIGENYNIDDTYKNSITALFNNGYSKVNGKITGTANKVNVKVNTDTDGIVLNNISIKNNSENEDTSLRYDILTDIDNEKNAIKINDKYSKKELKEKIEKMGYKCK